jgi:uncharacterized membrane protein required for colicin V production
MIHNTSFQWLATYDSFATNNALVQHNLVYFYHELNNKISQEMTRSIEGSRPLRKK